jgi:hypothetical protein
MTRPAGSSLTRRRIRFRRRARQKNGWSKQGRQTKQDQQIE